MKVWDLHCDTLIELRRAESDDAQGVPVVAPVDPVGALCGDLREIAGHGE